MLHSSSFEPKIWKKYRVTRASKPPSYTDQERTIDPPCTIPLSKPVFDLAQVYEPTGTNFIFDENTKPQVLEDDFIAA